MAGTLFGLGLSQRVDINGNPEGGWLLYVYDAGGSTPAATYSDTGLTTALSFPIEADSYGMLPDFWVADGSYRARGTTSTGGQVFFDRDNLLAIGPSSGSSGGGSTVDQTALIATGDMFFRLTSGSRTGAVRCNGLTIGAVSSGGTERANSDTQPLYEFLWNNFNNTLCPVTSGRGASAVADFTANKSIGTPDMRGYGPFGLDDMGNSAAGRIAGAILAAQSGGGESATIAQANLPDYALTSTLAAPAHTHTAGSFAVGTTISNGSSVAKTSGTTNTGTGGSSDPQVNASQTLSLASGAVSGTSGGASATALTGSVTLGGSGTALSTISPYRVGTWYIKL